MKCNTIEMELYLELYFLLILEITHRHSARERINFNVEKEHVISIIRIIFQLFYFIIFR